MSGRLGTGITVTYNPATMVTTVIVTDEELHNNSLARSCVQVFERYIEAAKDE